MSNDRIDILDETTDEVVASCYGPTAEGKCPYVNARGIVRCAGHRIAPTANDAGPEYWHLWVPGNSEHCPLAWNMADVGMI
jgi:hypothetical protein